MEKGLGNNGQRSLERIDNAIDFIEENLTLKLSLDEIAACASYSKFHFTRLFRDVTGDTVGNYIRKRRISESSMELLKTNLSIINIAFKYQFESQQAYTRSFQAVFDISPGRYRKKGHKLVPFSRYKLSPQKLKDMTNNAFTVPRIEIIADKKLVGMQISTSLKAQAVTGLWQEFMPRRNEIKGRIGQSYFAVQSYPSNLEFEDFHEETNFVLWAAVEVDAFEKVPHGMNSLLLEGGKFLVFPQKGLADEVRRQIDYIYGQWLPESSHVLANKNHFQVMGERYYGPNHPDSEEEIWVPIKV